MESTNRAADATMPTPFWTRIPHFFIFPLRFPQILGRICLFGAIPAIGVFATGMQAMFIAIAGLSLLAWIFFLRHGSRVLCETARGRLSPADYSWEEDETLAHLPYKLFGLFFITSTVVGMVASFFGEGASMVANLAVMLIMPAATMVLVHTRSLSSGLNPSLAWEVVKVMGKPYLLLCLFLFCLSTSQIIVSYWLLSSGFWPLIEKWSALQTALSQVNSDDDMELVEPLFAAFGALLRHLRPRLMLSVFGFTATAMYFTMIAFNMMGYALYQYHRLLGLETDAPKPGNAKPEHLEADAIADLIAAGKIDEALDIAYEAQRVEPDNVELQMRYHKLLHLGGKDERMLSHAQRLLGLLLRKQMPGKALDTLRRCRQKSPEFRPEDPATVLALAKAARSARDSKFALEILRSFDRLFRNHPLIPEVYSLSALILCEDIGHDAAADRIFAVLCQRFPDHPCSTQAQEYRQALARLQAAGNSAS